MKRFDTEKADEIMKHGIMYVKKPIPVRAVQVAEPFKVESLEGMVNGKTGDYLVRGTHGEYYVCDKAIFEDNYVRFEDNG